MKEQIPKEQVLRAINYKIKFEERSLKEAKDNISKRIYSRSVAVLRELRGIYENCETMK